MIYQPEHFNIAVHIRVGDIQPTSEDFFLKVLEQITPRLQDISYRIYVFTEKAGPDKFPKISATYQDKVRFLTDMTPFETFQHLTQPNVLVMSASGFSQFAGLVSTKSLQFSPPSREKFPLKYCPPGAVCTRKDGSFDYDGIIRLHWYKHRWLQAKKIRNEIGDLEEMLSLAQG